jgi:hypothetical protein
MWFNVVHNQITLVLALVLDCSHIDLAVHQAQDTDWILLHPARS